jgi:SAM-dependent methyltransferase
MRALFAFLDTINLPNTRQVYVGERVTAAYMRLEQRFQYLTGSEYLGESVPPGTVLNLNGINVRHEDLTHLSFRDGQFGAVITMDVFEHIPNYRAAFREARRVLNEEGVMVFTIPFFASKATTSMRASIADNGSIVYYFPPEYHGNPVGDGTSLCFSHFGWDILDDLRNAGFATASADLYWGPWQGHLGTPFFVFSARCRYK